MIQRNGGRAGKAPLLILAKSHFLPEPDSPPQFFLIVNPMFRPFDMNLWRCSIVKQEDSLCPEANCPKDFVLELKWVRVTDPSGPCDGGRPDLLSMHNLVYSFRGSDLCKAWSTKLLWDYEVADSALKLLRVRGLDFSDAGLNFAAQLHETCLEDEDPSFADAAAFLRLVKEKDVSRKGFSGARVKASEPKLSTQKSRVSVFGSRAAHANKDANPAVPAPEAASSRGSKRKRKDPSIDRECETPTASSSAKGAGSSSDPVQEDEAFLKETERNWLHALNVEDPDINLEEDQKEDSTYTDEKGYVFEGDSKTPLGSIKELSAHLRNHSLKITCYQHSQCSLFRRIHKVPPNADTLARKWLLEGKKYGKRSDGKLHVKDALRYFPL